MPTASSAAIEKTFEGRRPRTWITATPAGRKALTAEIAALREIVGAAEQRPRRGARAAADSAL
jgi:winged helix DNA-binding protein